MKKNTLLQLLACMLLSFYCNAQTPLRLWRASVPPEKRFLGFQGKIGVDSSGNTYFALNESYHNNQGHGVWLWKIDKNGNNLWNKQHIESEGPCGYTGMVTDAAGNTSLLGQIDDGGGYYLAFLARYDAEGNRLWSYNLDLPGEYGAVHQLALDAQSGDIVFTAGSGKINNTYDSIMYVQRINPAGNLVWSRQYYKQTNADLLITDNGDIHLLGVKNGAVNYKKMNSAGRLLLNAPDSNLHVYPSNTHNEGQSFDVDNNGNIYFTAYGKAVKAQGYKEMVIKLDPAGHLAYADSVGHDCCSNFFWDSKIGVNHNNGEVYLSNTMNVSDIYDSTRLQKFNPAGKPAWSKVVPKIISFNINKDGIIYFTGMGIYNFSPADGSVIWSYADTAHYWQSASMITDTKNNFIYYVNGLFITDNTDSNFHVTKIKYGSSSFTAKNLVNTSAPAQDKIKPMIYPNPVADKLVIYFNNAANQKGMIIEVYNIQGQKIISWPVQEGAKQTIIPAGSLAKGVYICHLHGNQSDASANFTKQ